MKRALVEYDSSSDDGVGASSTSTPKPPNDPPRSNAPPLKRQVSYHNKRGHFADVLLKDRRKLPSLSKALLDPKGKRSQSTALACTHSATAPIDNPSLHQGRTRSQPHVEGNWATHIYVLLKLSSSHHPKLLKLLRRAVAAATRRVPQLHSFLDSSGDQGGNETELHISLSRPLFIREHQKDLVKGAVKQSASSKSCFRASFASFTTFTNDDKTRAFLSVEIGAGHAECEELALGLNDVLDELRQQGYYAEPRFHASIAWALLCQTSTPRAPLPSRTPSTSEPAPSTSKSDDTLGISPHPSITSFPDDLTNELENNFGDELRRLGSFDVDVVSVKIGKLVTSWQLAPQ
ncbi:hypothetical protein DL93DRAFT_2126061 [Clavulina sp. PMI_390]|nr:hypothetical protein DL93DRAFT_2126061 [Clavulina sp. PMI_390]